MGVGADRLTSDNKRSTLLVKHRVAIGVKQHAVAGDDAAWNVCYQGWSLITSDPRKTNSMCVAICVLFTLCDVVLDVISTRSSRPVGHFGGIKTLMKNIDENIGTAW